MKITKAESVVPSFLAFCLTNLALDFWDVLELIPYTDIPYFLIIA